MKNYKIVYWLKGILASQELHVTNWQEVLAVLKQDIQVIVVQVFEDTNGTNEGLQTIKCWTR